MGCYIRSVQEISIATIKNAQSISMYGSKAVDEAFTMSY